MTTINLDNIGSFTNAQIEIVQKHLNLRHLAKSEMLLRQGQVCASVCYLVSGSVYQFQYEDIDENIIELPAAADGKQNIPAAVLYILLWPDRGDDSRSVQ